VSLAAALSGNSYRGCPRPNQCGGSGRGLRGFRPPRPFTRARRTALRAPRRPLTRFACGR